MTWNPKTWDLEMWFMVAICVVLFLALCANAYMTYTLWKSR